MVKRLSSVATWKVLFKIPFWSKKRRFFCLGPGLAKVWGPFEIQQQLRRCQGTFETLFLSWTASWALAPVMCEKPSDLYYNPLSLKSKVGNGYWTWPSFIALLSPSEIHEKIQQQQCNKIHHLDSNLIEFKPLFLESKY